MAASANMLQTFELRNYKVCFQLKDGLAAENLLDSLDRATPIFKQVFNTDAEPDGIFYLLDDVSEVEANIGIRCKPTDSVSFNIATNSIAIIIPKLGTSSCGEIGVRELGHMYFNKSVNEREVRMRQWRTPSWLREGFALQASYKIRQAQIEFLQKGWEKLQAAQKNNQLLKPSMMLKEISIMPDLNKKELALFQSYYLVKHLLTIYCDKFFSKYSTLMKALEDMEAETCFRQITSFDFEKFFSMFDSFVQKNNAWSAME